MTEIALTRAEDAAHALSEAKANLEHAQQKYAEATAWADPENYEPGSLAWVRAMRYAISTSGGCSRCDAPLPALEDEENWDEPTEEELELLPPAELAAELTRIQEQLLLMEYEIGNTTYCHYCQRAWEKVLAE
jgi:hypothetical protein